MLTKKIKVLALGFLLFGCALEDLPYQEIPKVSAGSECLAETKGIPQKYFDGNASETDVQYFWGCIGGVIKKFYTQTEGSLQRDSYTKKEISRFLQDNFLDDQKILSPQLVDSIMIAKRLIVGGNTNQVSKSELKSLRFIFEQDLSQITVDLLPHIRLILLSEVDTTEVKYEKALSALYLAGRRLAHIVSYNQNQVRIETFVSIVNEFTKLIKGMEQTAKSVNQYLLLFGEVKALFLNTSTKLVLPEEWGQLFHIAVSAFGEVARFNYFIKPSWYGSVGVDALDSVRATAQSLLSGAVAYYPNQEIPLKRINALVDALYKSEIYVLGLSAADLKSVIGKLLNKILVPSNKFQGLKNAHLGALEKLWNRFYVAQLFLLGGERVQSENLDEFEEVVIKGPWRLAYDAEERLYFDTIPRTSVDIKSATFLNWERVLVKTLIDSYAPEAKEELSVELLEILYWDIRPVLVGLGLISKHDQDFYKNLHLEADLFMPRSDGNKSINFFEGVEYIHYVFAAISAGRVYVEKFKPHCDLHEKSASPFFEPQCALRNMVSAFSESLDHMAGFLSFYSFLDISKKNLVVTDLLDVVWAEEDRDAHIWTSDLKEQLALLQYVETIMLRFDKDYNGFLDLKEVMSAFPLFEKTVGDIIGLDATSEEDRMYIKALFTYMLKFARIPDFNKPIDSLRFLDWRWHPEKWKLKATRLEIVKVLASLKKF